MHAPTVVNNSNYTRNTTATLRYDGSCTVDEFLTGDSDLSVCVEMDDDNWDTRFLEELGKDQDSR